MYVASVFSYMHMLHIIVIVHEDTNYSTKDAVYHAENSQYSKSSVEKQCNVYEEIDLGHASSPEVKLSLNPAYSVPWILIHFIQWLVIAIHIATFKSTMKGMYTALVYMIMHYVHSYTCITMYSDMLTTQVIMFNLTVKY